MPSFVEIGPPVLEKKIFVCLFVCAGLTSLSALSVISRQCLVVTGSSMLTFIVLPHCGIRSLTLLPDTTSSHIIQVNLIITLSLGSMKTDRVMSEPCYNEVIYNRHIAK